MSLPDAIPLNAVIDRDALGDGRARFREILSAVNTARGADLPDTRPTADILLTLGDEPPVEEAGTPVSVDARLDGVNVVAVPGFLAECINFFAPTLADALKHLENLGARTSIAPVAGRGDCAENAKRLKAHLQSLGTQDGPTILVPMSKGTPDTLEMFDLYPETIDRVDAVVSLVGCVCGSPLKYMAPEWLKWIERNLPMPSCARFGGTAVVSLSPHTRCSFLKAFEMPGTVKVYSLGAVADADRMSRGMTRAYRALTQIHPLNDGQMLLQDQILPKATYLGTLNCDHVAAGMPFNRNASLICSALTRLFLNHNAFPREVMVEAVVRQVLEDLG